MKIHHTHQEVKSIIDVEIEDVFLSFCQEGIRALVEIAGDQDDSNDNEEGFLVSWDSILQCALASSWEEGDAEGYATNLRAIADKLDAWAIECKTTP